MGKLVECKSCKHTVDRSAKTCPSCGVSHPGIKGLQGCLVFSILLIFVMVGLGLMQDDEISIPTQVSINDQEETKGIEERNQSAKQQKEFKISAEQYIERFNQSSRTLGSDLEIHSKKEKDNSEWVTIEIASNKNIGMILTANRKNRNLTSFTFVGGGTGELRSGVDVLFGITTSIMAIEDPGMDQTERGGILSDLGLTNNEFLKGNNIKIERNGAEYSLIFNESIGMMLSGEPL